MTLAVVLTLTLGSFVYELNNTSFYKSQFEKRGSNETLGLNVVSFVNGRGELSNEFNDAELAHLRDVRSLFFKIKMVYYASLLVFFGLLAYSIYSHRFHEIAPASLVRGGVATLIILAVLFVASLAFSQFFTAIHVPFFVSGSYVFPQDSLLIQLFPEDFFKSFTYLLFRFVFINAAIFFAIGAYTRRKHARHSQKL